MDARSARMGRGILNPREGETRFTLARFDASEFKAQTGRTPGEYAALCGALRAPATGRREALLALGLFS